MELSITGKVKLVEETQTWDSGFCKREFVVTTQEQYPQDVKFEAVKEKVDLLDKFPAGSDVTVSFNVRGNEYNGKYYVNLQAWKINAAAPAAQGGAPAPEPAQQSAGEEEDDLPF